MLIIDIIDVSSAIAIMFNSFLKLNIISIVDVIAIFHLVRSDCAQDS